MKNTGINESLEIDLKHAMLRRILPPNKASFIG
jgi:hypothetical protein